MILVTGSAGFIGFHLTKKLLEEGYEVIGVDNFNDYYSVELKEARNKILEGFENFKLERGDIANLKFVEKIFREYRPEVVYNLAAQAGVRYCYDNPYIYGESNLFGFTNILNECNDSKVKKLLYASSSTVYGGIREYPYKENMQIDKPISFYAATKKANELMAYSYYAMFNLKSVGFRFFTVYGPWGRPDMAYFKFANRIVKEEKIDIYNYGKMERDFTYIDDIVDGLFAALKTDFKYEVINLGKGKPDKLMDMVKYVEEGLEIDAEKNFMEIQPGEVLKTWADTSKAEKILGYKPQVSLKEGITRFMKWYKEYYKIDS